MAGINKPMPASVSAMYLGGMSIPEVSAQTGIPASTLRCRLKKEGILRSRTEGVRAAAERGRLGSGMRGTKRQFSESHREAMRAAKLKWGEESAAGVSLKPSGYLEHTRGEHKGRSVHAVIMEERLGRRLKPDEVVHHIDGDRQNNEDNNLALLTRAGHSRLHRREDELAGTERRRSADGKWS